MFVQKIALVVLVAYGSLYGLEQVVSDSLETMSIDLTACPRADSASDSILVLKDGTIKVTRKWVTSASPTVVTPGEGILVARSSDTFSIALDTGVLNRKQDTLYRRENERNRVLGYTEHYPGDGYNINSITDLWTNSYYYASLTWTGNRIHIKPPLGYSGNSGVLAFSSAESGDKTSWTVLNKVGKLSFGYTDTGSVQDSTSTITDTTTVAFAKDSTEFYRNVRIGKNVLPVQSHTYTDQQAHKNHRYGYLIKTNIPSTSEKNIRLDIEATTGADPNGAMSLSAVICCKGGTNPTFPQSEMLYTASYLIDTLYIPNLYAYDSVGVVWMWMYRLYGDTTVYPNQSLFFRARTDTVISLAVSDNVRGNGNAGLITKVPRRAIITEGNRNAFTYDSSIYARVAHRLTNWIDTIISGQVTLMPAPADAYSKIVSTTWYPRISSTTNRVEFYGPTSANVAITTDSVFTVESRISTVRGTETAQFYGGTQTILGNSDAAHTSIRGDSISLETENTMIGSREVLPCSVFTGSTFLYDGTVEQKVFNRQVFLTFSGILFGTMGTDQLTRIQFPNGRLLHSTSVLEFTVPIINNGVRGHGTLEVPITGNSVYLWLPDRDYLTAGYGGLDPTSFTYSF